MGLTVWARVLILILELIAGGLSKGEAVEQAAKTFCVSTAAIWRRMD